MTLYLAYRTLYIAVYGHVRPSTASWRCPGPDRHQGCGQDGSVQMASRPSVTAIHADLPVYHTEVTLYLGTPSDLDSSYQTTRTR